MLRNKKIFVVLVFFALLFSLMPQVKAAEENIVTINGKIYYLSNYAGTGFCVYSIEEDTIYVYTHWRRGHGDCGTIKHYIEDDETTFTIKSKCDHFDTMDCYTYYKYNSENNTFEEVDVKVVTEIPFEKSKYKFVYGYNKIYTDNTYSVEYDFSNCDFFMPAPKVTTELVKVIQKSHLEELMKEILKLIPLIIVVVVSLVGLRKGWRLLSKILHQA